MNTTSNHKEQIAGKGLTNEKVNQQITLFKTGLPYVNLKSAATLGDGIQRFADDEKEHYLRCYEAKKKGLDILKFVPASGAATRMFKFLFQFLENYDPESESVNSYINRNKANELSLFFSGLEKFPFYNRVLDATKQNSIEFNDLSSDLRKVSIVESLLGSGQLNYGWYPKGLLPFHKYNDRKVTAFEEHLFDAALYVSVGEEAKLHFTISKKHHDVFKEEFKRVQHFVEQKTKTKFDISFSFQKESTDTIAVNLNNDPFINPDGSLCFRPSGHGALLANLNDFEADVVFVNNIDNVVVSKYKEEVAVNKKVLAGVLLEIQEQVFKFLNDLENKELSEDRILIIAQFLTRKLNVVISPEFEKYSLKYQVEYLKEKLNRPIRVCGMVKNEGEPGGGPFWVKNEGGSISLQIVESAQIDKKNKQQKDILKSATHFNPVDLVCGIKNYKGKPFDLFKFVDPKTAFITKKTVSGKEIKALELPGLWNGAMANWNTIFVEVPLITFNPVKTVNDLLKATHQVL